MSDTNQQRDGLGWLSRPLESRRLRRNSDPETSHVAARAVASDGTAAKARAETLAAVTRWPMLTTSELAHNACVRDPRFLGRRLPELERAGQVVRHPARECAVTGRKAAVWDVARTERQGLMFGDTSPKQKVWRSGDCDDA